MFKYTWPESAVLLIKWRWARARQEGTVLEVSFRSSSALFSAFFPLFPFLPWLPMWWSRSHAHALHESPLVTSMHPTGWLSEMAKAVRQEKTSWARWVSGPWLWPCYWGPSGTELPSLSSTHMWSQNGMWSLVCWGETGTRVGRGGRRTLWNGTVLSATKMTRFCCFGLVRQLSGSLSFQQNLPVEGKCWFHLVTFRFEIRAGTGLVRQSAEAEEVVCNPLIITPWFRVLFPQTPNRPLFGDQNWLGCQAISQRQIVLFLWVEILSCNKEGSFNKENLAYEMQSRYIFKTIG